jgi:hypothetical protein
MCDPSSSIRTKIKLLSEAGWKDSMPIASFAQIYIFARILENGCKSMELDRGSISLQDFNEILKLIIGDRAK